MVLGWPSQSLVTVRQLFGEFVYSGWSLWSSAVEQQVTWSVEYYYYYYYFVGDMQKWESSPVGCGLPVQLYKRCWSIFLVSLLSVVQLVGPSPKQFARLPLSIALSILTDNHGMIAMKFIYCGWLIDSISGILLWNCDLWICWRLHQMDYVNRSWTV